jgi:membrane-associated HD superfamily phosphohydrolase
MDAYAQNVKPNALAPGVVAQDSAPDPGHPNKESGRPIVAVSVFALFIAIALFAVLRRKEPPMSLKHATLTAIVLIAIALVGTIYEAFTFSLLGPLVPLVPGVIEIALLVFFATLHEKQGAGT